jgi:hypothetical protein
MNPKTQYAYEEIRRMIDTACESLEPTDYKQVMEELYAEVQCRLDCVEQELQECSQQNSAGDPCGGPYPGDS